MKKLILSALSIMVIGSIVFISCKSKNDSDAITPTYKDEAQTGTGNNPNITNVTTTGTIATTSTQQNSSMSSVGIGSAWTSAGCQAGQTCLTNVNTSTSTTVTVCFSTPPTAGNYSLVNSSSLLGPNKAFMTVTNPPSQDSGSSWYSSAGNITVTIGGTGSITATFSNIACYKTPGSFYSVTVSGQVGCLL
ncbi:MAG: hypothetical protein H7141_00800 [Burkholderiales bacterium]|nr:hypothetical protein [Bacteroidia bacterium]